MSCSCKAACECASVPQTFRLAILPALSAADAVIGMLDLAPTAVSIITRKWSKGERGKGTYGDNILELPRWLVVEEVTNREVMQAPGRFSAGDLRVGPIRPRFVQDGCESDPRYGGFTEEQLRPTTRDEATEIIYRCAREHELGTGWSGDYGLQELIREDPLEFYLILRRHIKTANPIPPLDAASPIPSIP